MGIYVELQDAVLDLITSIHGVEGMSMLELAEAFDDAQDGIPAEVDPQALANLIRCAYKYL